MIIDNVAGSDVTLLLPGLLAGDYQPHQFEKYPALGRIAAGASKSQVQTASLESAVLNWFHGTDTPLQNSAASLGYRLDYPQAAVARHCLRADPVFQQLDINEAILADRSVLDIQMPEAQEIVSDLNRHFSEDGVIFSCAAPDRWYCEFPRSMDVQTMSPGAATGRSVSLSMVQGDDAGMWRAWLTEIEMLLYSHSVNQQRNATGRTAINSLWLWGEGDAAALKSLNCVRSGGRVYSDQFYTLSLATHLGVESLPVSDFSSDIALKDVLVVDDRLSSAFATGDIARYESTLAELEAVLFAELDNACRRHPKRSVAIWGGDNHWWTTSGRAVAGGWLSRLCQGLSTIRRLNNRDS